MCRQVVGLKYWLVVILLVRIVIILLDGRHHLDESDLFSLAAWVLVLSQIRHSLFAGAALRVARLLINCFHQHSVEAVAVEYEGSLLILTTRIVHPQLLIREGHPRGVFNTINLASAVAEQFVEHLCSRAVLFQLVKVLLLMLVLLVWIGLPSFKLDGSLIICSCTDLLLKIQAFFFAHQSRLLLLLLLASSFTIQTKELLQNELTSGDAINLTYFRLKSFKPFFWSIKLSLPSFLPSECLNFLSVGESEKREPPSKRELECLAVHSRQTEVALFFLRFLRAAFFLLPLRDMIWCLAWESYFRVKRTWRWWLNALDSLETNSSSPTLRCNS